MPDTPARQTARIEVFRPGTFTPMGRDPISYTAADLRAIADAYDPQTAPAPVVVGHPSVDAPAYGWIDRFDYDAATDRLFATVTDIDPGFADLVKAGRFRKVSMAYFSPDQAHNPVPGVWYPKHLGFLGAAPPAVPGLRNAAFAGDAGAIFTATFGDPAAEETAGILRALREFFIDRFGLEDADRALPGWRIEWLGEMGKAPAAPAFSADPAPAQSQPASKETIVSEPDPAFAAREAELAARERQLAERAAEIAHADHVAFAERLVEEGRLLPVSRDKVVAKAATKDLETALAGVAEASRRAGDATAGNTGALSTAQAATAGLTTGLRDQVEAFLAAARAGAEWRADLEAIRARINPLFAAARELEASIEDLTVAEEMGAISAREATIAHDGLSRALTDLREKAAGAGVALDGIGAPVTATSTAMQLLIERNTGMAQSADGSIAATLRHGEALDTLRARFNPIFAASRQYEQALREIADAEARGAISALEAAAARDRAGQAMAPMAGQMGAFGAATQSSAHYAGQLTYQLNDIGIMMASGQNPLILAMQQGTQVAQVFGDMRSRGLALGPAIAGAFGGMLSPVSLATIAIIAFGAAAVQWLTSGTEKAKTLEDAMGDLSTRMGNYQKIAREVSMSSADLSARFGSNSDAARRLLRDLEALEASRALQAASDAFGALFREQGGYAFSTGKFEKMFGMPWAEDPAMSAANPVVSAMASVQAARLERDPEARLQKMSAAMAAFVEQVRIAADFDGKRTQAEEDLLATLVEQNLVLAEQAALRDGSARAEAISRQVGQMSLAYAQQAELTRTIALHGEGSAEAEALRARHLRDGLEARLAEMGAAEAGVDVADLRASLEGRITAEAEARAMRQGAAMAAQLDDLDRQERLSTAILTFGEASAEVEAIRAEQAREVYHARLAEQGILGPMAANLERLMEAEQGRQRLIRQQAAGRQADGMLAKMREERAIGLAILTHGEGSLRVRELQIAAERRLYQESLATLQVSEARKQLLMDEWDLTHGLKSADPFGTVAANRNALRSHQERVERLQLELRLVGAASAARAKAIAMHEAEVEARKVGGDVSEWRARAGALSDLTRELERQTEAWDRAHKAAEGMIDGPIDALMKGDLKGALASFGQELVNLWTEMAIKNPLKNRLLGTNYATIDDLGGLGGFFGRMFGGQPALPETARAQALAAQMMTVTTPMVNISTSGLTGLPLAAGLGPAANSPLAPQVAMMTGPSQAGALLRGVAAGGALRPDALASLNGPFAAQLAAMVGEAQAIFGPAAVKITSAFRSVERQAEIFSDAVRKYGSEAAARKWAAPPGRSMHNHGLAADLKFGGPSVQSWFHQNAGRFGLGFPMGWEPWHIEPANARAMRQAPELPVAQLERLAITTEMATGQLGTFGARAETTGQGLAAIGGTFAQALQMFGASKGPGGMLAATLLGGLFRGIGLPGFRFGGPTPPGPPDEVAGVVHAGEYVFDAAATRRIGVASLDAIRRGSMKGYREGGVVHSSKFPVAQRGSGDIVPDHIDGGTDRRAVFEINVAGTGDAQIAAGVRAAIEQAFDQYDRNVFAGRVRMVLNDEWAA